MKKKVNISISRAQDGTYTAICEDHPALFGSGDSASQAKAELVETLRLTKEDGPEHAFVYPEWLDDEYEFVTHWDVMAMMDYYSGVITPTALGRLSGIHPKQIWSYMHGVTKPRNKQIDKMEKALHQLGRELLNSSLVIIALLFVSACDLVTAEAPQGLEMPAVVAQDNIMEYKGYVVSYNTQTLIPNWVAYELTEEETHGDATREDKDFSMDFNFKGPQARREDYFRSGWTRGHMAPAGDFFWSDEAMAETFYFLNICPQKEELNNKDWQYLEKQIRRWAREYGRVWVVSGPIIGDNKYGTIGPDKVVVPDAFFKVALVHDGTRYQAVAFIMQNDAKRYYLEKCALSVDDLELLTGLDFYPALPDDMEEYVEMAYDPAVWGLRQ